MSQQEFSDQDQNRRESLIALRRLGIDPYPAASYPVNAWSAQILSQYAPDVNNFQEVSLAGRIMSRRIMGNASFVELQDSQGRIQLYFKRDDICTGEDKTLYNTVFKKLLDIGDFIGVRGFVFTTRMGEIWVHVQEFTVLSKTLRVLPVVKEKDGQIFDAFSDPEQRYRQRYVDLVVNPQVREVFFKRTTIINTMRQFFNSRGYCEVETPVLQPIPGGAAARPFVTHHNALDMPLYLRIANELYLKRLIVGGYDGVYEFSRNFRNEGMDRTHNPEFTVMEIYVAYKDYLWMMDFTEEMIERVATELHGSAKVPYAGSEIDFSRPFRRVRMLDAIREYAGVDVTGMNDVQLRLECERMGISVNPTMGKGKLIDAIFGEKCEHHLVQPTFIIDYPEEMSPLTKKHRSDPGLTERFELFVNGKELCNAYSELNDPIDQLDRFKQQFVLSEKGDDEAMFIDHDFVRSLEYGMPPTSGMGIGVDRLVMFMTGQQSIQDVLFFPQMKPENPVRKSVSADYELNGIPSEWAEILIQMGISSDQVTEITPGKLFNDLCGFNKKNKLGLKNPTLDEVKSWLEKATL